MGEFLIELFTWLNHHCITLLLTGMALSLAANLRTYKNDKKAAQRFKDSVNQPVVLPSHPLVSFLVPAWNEAAHVEACIRSILALRLANKELILCAGGTDETLAICNRFAGDGVIVMEQKPGGGKQGALQRCFAHSHGEILFLTDADCVLDDACVGATLAPLLSKEANIVTGHWQPFKSLMKRPFITYQWANHLRYQANTPDWADTLDGRNSALWREALVAAGAFHTAATTGTDYVLSQQLKGAGHRIRSVLASRVQTEYPLEIRDYLRQGSRWYRNRLVQGVKFKQWRDVGISLWGAAAALFTLAGALTLLMGWKALACAWIATVFHLVLSAGRLAGFVRLLGISQQGYPGTALKFTGYIMVSNLAMITGLLASLSPRGRKAW